MSRSMFITTITIVIIVIISIISIISIITPSCESYNNIYLKNVSQIDAIKNPFFQIYINFDKKKIPKDVYDNIKKYAPECTHIIVDEVDIEKFLNKYYTQSVLNTFKSLKSGAHKADLARYCLLYIYGGIYMDIKVELIKPLKDVFNKGDDLFYSVLSYRGDHIAQGVIKSPPRNPLFLSLIDYVVKTQNPRDFHDFCKDLYIKVKKDVGKVTTGLLIGKKEKYYLFKEVCETDCSRCHDGCDTKGRCCFVWDGNTPIIKTRRNSYPWK